MKHSSFTILILIFLSLPSTSILPMVEGSTTLSFCPGNYVVSYQNTTLNVSDITILRVQDPTEVVVSPPGLPLPKVPPGEYMVKLVNSSILIVYPSTVDGCSLEPPHINVGNEAVMVSLECVTDILYVGIGHIDTNSSQALPLYRYMYNVSNGTIVIPGKKIPPLLLGEGRQVTFIADTCQGIWAFSLIYTNKTSDKTENSNAGQTNQYSINEKTNTSLPYPPGASSMNNSLETGTFNQKHEHWLVLFVAVTSVILYLVWVVKRGQARKGH